MNSGNRRNRGKIIKKNKKNREDVVEPQKEAVMNYRIG